MILMLMPILGWRWGRGLECDGGSFIRSWLGFWGLFVGHSDGVTVPFEGGS